MTTLNDLMKLVYNYVIEYPNDTFGETEHAALERALEAVVRDAERMEHLCKSVRCSSANIDGNHSWNFNYGHGWKMGANFREAVDRSMKEMK